MKELEPCLHLPISASKSYNLKSSAVNTKLFCLDYQSASGFNSCLSAKFRISSATKSLVLGEIMSI